MNHPDINILLQNNSPIDDFSGLTPNQLHDLLYNTFSPDSPLKLNDNIPNDILDQVPFFRLTEEFLKIIEREGEIKLTPLGALPRKVLLELYDHKFILEEVIERGITKLHREIDSPVLTSLHINTNLAKAIKKTNGKLTLTKTGKGLLAADKRNELFKVTLQRFTQQFNWGYNDGFADEAIIQLGWAYTIFLLLKFGGEPREIKFYSDKYLKAFPVIERSLVNPPYGTPDEYLSSWFYVQAIHRFAEWFGFIVYKSEPNVLKSSAIKIQRSDCLADIFTTVE